MPRFSLFGRRPRSTRRSLVFCLHVSRSREEFRFCLISDSCFCLKIQRTILYLFNDCTPLDSQIGWLISVRGRIAVSCIYAPDDDEIWYRLNSPRHLVPHIKLHARCGVENSETFSSNLIDSWPRDFSFSFFVIHWKCIALGRVALYNYNLIYSARRDKIATKWNLRNFSIRD